MATGNPFGRENELPEPVVARVEGAGAAERIVVPHALEIGGKALENRAQLASKLACHAIDVLS